MRNHGTALEAWRANKITAEELASALDFPLEDLDVYFETGARPPPVRGVQAAGRAGLALAASCGRS